MNDQTNMEMTGEERDMVLKCMRDIGISSHPDEPEPLMEDNIEDEIDSEDEINNAETNNGNEINNEDVVNNEMNNENEEQGDRENEQNQGVVLPSPPSSSKTEGNNEALEEAEPQIDLPQREEDDTQIPSPINNSIRSPGTLELFLPTPSSPPCPSGLKEREEACNMLLEKVVGAIGQLEKVISNLNDKITEVPKDKDTGNETEKCNQEENQNVNEKETPQIQKEKAKRNPETWMSLKKYAKRKTEEIKRKSKKTQPKNGKTKKKEQNAIPQNHKQPQTDGKATQNTMQRDMRQFPPTRGPTQMRKTSLTSYRAPYPKGQKEHQGPYQKRRPLHKQNHPQMWRKAPQEQEWRQERVYYHRSHPHQRYTDQNPHWISHPQPWRPPQRQGRFPQRGNYHWAQGRAGGRQWQEGGYGRWGWN